VSDTLTPTAHSAVERLAFTIEEACEATTLGRSKLLELVYDGSLPSRMVGRRRLIPASALRQFIDGRPDDAA
jgi:excisionase family DNA binding protein